jgi:hypothetical protein
MQLLLAIRSGDSMLALGPRGQVSGKGGKGLSEGRSAFDVQ